MLSPPPSVESPVARCGFVRTLATRNSAGGNVVGYARAFQNPTSLELQVARLGEAGASEVYSDASKGAGVIRPGLDAVLASIQPSDCIAVTSLDRLTWREDQLRQLIATIGDRKAHLWAMAEDFDTRRPSDVFSTVRAFDVFAARVRLARERQGGPKRPDGRQRISDEEWAEAVERLESGELTAAQLAKSFGVARSTISRRQRAPSIGATEPRLGQ